MLVLHSLLNVPSREVCTRCLSACRTWRWSLGASVVEASTCAVRRCRCAAWWRVSKGTRAACQIQVSVGGFFSMLTHIGDLFQTNLVFTGTLPLSLTRTPHCTPVDFVAQCVSCNMCVACTFSDPPFSPHLSVCCSSFPSWTKLHEVLLVDVLAVSLFFCAVMHCSRQSRNITAA